MTRSSRSNRPHSRGSAGWTALFVALAALAAGQATAQSWSGSSNLGVQVRSTRGGPVAGATVEIRSPRPGGRVGPEARLTDSKGQANFVGLAAGRWNLEVRHPDFLSFVASVEVAGGKKPEVVSQFLEASGAGRGTLKVKFIRSGQPFGQIVAGTATQDIAPAPTFEPSRTAERAPAPKEPELILANPEMDEAEPSEDPAPQAAEPAPKPQELILANPEFDEPEPSEEPEPTSAQPAQPARPVSRPAPPESTPPPREAEPAPPIEAKVVPVRVVEPPAPEPDQPAPTAPEAEAEIRASDTPRPLEAATPEPISEPADSPAEPTPDPVEAKEPESTTEPPPIPEPEPMPEPMPEPEPEPAPESEPMLEPAPEQTSAPAPPVPAVPPADASPPSPDPEPAPADTEPAPAPAPSPAPEAELSKEPAAPTSEEAPVATEPTEPEPTLQAPATATDSLRAYRDRSCTDCKPGEWAVSVAVETGTGEPCRPTAERSVRRAMRDVAAVASDKLGDYAGPLPLDPGEMPLVLTSEAARNTLARYLESGASCRLLAAVIPQGARFAGFRFEASDSAGTGDCAGSGDCAIPDARFVFSPGIARGLGASIVFTLFENTGAATRSARMNAFFVPGSGWRP